MWHKSSGATWRLMAVNCECVQLPHTHQAYRIKVRVIGMLVTLFLQLVCNRDLCLTLSSSAVCRIQMKLNVSILLLCNLQIVSSGGKAPRIPKLGTRCRKVMSFTERPLHPETHRIRGEGRSKIRSRLFGDELYLVVLTGNNTTPVSSDVQTATWLPSGVRYHVLV